MVSGAARWLPANPVTILQDVARQALGNRSAALESWQCDSIGAPVGSGFTAGVFRISGTARSGGQAAPWSAVLKVIRHPDGADRYDEPAGSNYWQREAFVYQSGLVADLPGGLCAPRCYGVAPGPDGAALIWLEDVPDRYGERWPLAAYGVAARHLGQFNGAYVTSRPLPDYPWLADKPLRAWPNAQARAAALAAQPAIWRRPLLRRAFPTPVAERLLRFWHERERFVSALARLPQTLCHFDAGHHNLLPEPSGDGYDRTVAIDWEFAGFAAVGEEIGLLVATPFIRHALNAKHVKDVQEQVFAGYLDGLQDAGWHGDPRAVRLAFAADAPLRSLFLAASLREVADEARQEREARRWGCPYEELLSERAALTYALLNLADEARDLIAAS